MCDQTEILYLDGDVVWVKLGSTWWPGEVLGTDRVPPEVLSSLRKTPIAVVKFFREESLELVKNINSIYKYNCSKKHEFIKKGLDQFRARHAHMELFPEYVREAEERTHGDPQILEAPEYQPPQKVDYAGLFGARKTPGSPSKQKVKSSTSPSDTDYTPKITHPRILQKFLKGTSDYKAHILVQEPRPRQEEELGEGGTATHTPAPASGHYTCHACPFSCTRINVMVLHNKCHSDGYVPYTPPKRHKPRPPVSSSKAKTPRARARPRAPRRLPAPPTSATLPRDADPPLPRDTEPPKSDLEIKNSLLADWSEDSNDSMDLLSALKLTENQSGKDDSSVHQDSTSGTEQMDTKDDEKENTLNVDNESPQDKVLEDKKISLGEEVDNKKMSFSEDVENKSCERKVGSCFDFDDEDEEMPIETIGRKIPRLSIKSDDGSRKILDLNPEPAEAGEPSPAEEDNRSNKLAVDLKLDAEINNLLLDTAVPMLPTLPSEPKFVESLIRSPEKISGIVDKEKPQTKSIFKTKTFFRSRHTRSQDAIEKYVADNTSVDKPPTYMEEPPELDIPLPPPSLAEAPDILHIVTPEVKVPKFAPKIQLKKMKAALGKKEKPFIVPPEDPVCQLDSLPVRDIVEGTPNITEGHYSKVEDSLPAGESVQEEVIPAGESIQEVIPAGESVQGEVIPAGESIQEEVIPAGESVQEVIPAGESIQEVIPAGESVQEEVIPAGESIQEEVIPAGESVQEVIPAGESVQEEVIPAKKSIREEVIPVQESIRNEVIPVQKSIRNEVISVQQSIREEVNPVQDSIQEEVTHVDSIQKEDIHESMEEVVTPIQESIEREVSPVQALIKEEVTCVQESITEEVISVQESIAEEVTPVQESIAEEVTPVQEFVEEEVTSDQESTVEEITPGQESTEEEMAPVQEFIQEEVIPVQESIQEEVIPIQESIQEELIPAKDSILDEVAPVEESFQEEVIPIQESIQEEIIPIQDIPMEDTSLGDNITSHSNLKYDTEGLTEVNVEPEALRECDIVDNETLANEVVGNVESTEEIPTEKKEEFSVEEIEHTIEETVTEDPGTLSHHMIVQEKTDSLDKSKPPPEFDVQDRWDNESVDNLLKTSTEEEKIVTKTCTVNDILGTMEDEPCISRVEVKSSIEIVNKEEQPNSVPTLLQGPTESDLQIAETLITLPTAGAPISNKLLENHQNFSAAKSLVQMSEALQSEQLASVDTFSLEDSLVRVPADPCDPPPPLSPSPKKTVYIKDAPLEHSKLFKILDEPKQKNHIKIIQNKPIPGKEKILNFQTSTPPHKPRVIIRRSGPPRAPPLLLAAPSRPAAKPPQDEEAFFDINSMPIVLSEEILTPENLDKMPIVLSEGLSSPSPRAKVKVIAPIKESVDAKKEKSKLLAESNYQKLTAPLKKYGDSKMNALLKPVMEKSASPNILSKSPKIRATKHLLVVDKTTGEQKIISTKSEEPPPPTKTIMKNTPTILTQQPKGEKFIILPPGTSGGTRTQKIIVNPQTGKSQIMIEEGQGKMKAASTAKIIQNRSGMDPSGNTVMILTNAQGVQSKIVLTPEHQRILFPKKASGPVVTSHTILSPRSRTAVTSQSIMTSRGQLLSPISGNALITSTGQLLPPRGRTVLTAKPNQTILTSRGQLITTQSSPVTSQAKGPQVTNITSMPVPRPTVSRAPKQGLLKASPKPSAPQMFIKSTTGKLISTDPASILQGKKPGTVMHLTAAQFEHLQKTGQIITTPQPSLTQIISPSQNKGIPGKMQQKFILQKYASNTKQTPQIITKQAEKKAEVSGMKRKALPSLVPTHSQPAPPPPKKQKLRELLTIKADSSTKKYPSPVSRSAAPQPVMDLGNLDDLIPATTISTCKGETRGSRTLHVTHSAPTKSDSHKAHARQRNSEIIIQKPPEIPAPEPEPPMVIPPPIEEVAPSLAAEGQLLAVPGENFGGPPNSFYLCMEENGTLTPIDNQPLVLENNQLVPMVLPPPVQEQRVILNAGEQQILVDQQTLLSLLGGEARGAEGQQLLLQGDMRQLLAALAPQQVPHSQDILAAALADTGDSLLMEMDSLGPDFHSLNASVSVNSNVSETSTTLKPIMSALEQPSKKRAIDGGSVGRLLPAGRLEDTLAVIGVSPPSVPTSLDLPITVTDPRIAPKVSKPLCQVFPPLEDKPGTTHTTASSLLTRVSQTNQQMHFSRDNSLKLPSHEKSYTTSREDFRRLPKQPASSMPCLDDSSSDSFASENPQLLTEAIQTKTYSPISMPLLTEDTSEAPPAEELAPDTLTAVKSMPVLMDSDDSTLRDGISTEVQPQSEESQESEFTEELPIVHSSLTQPDPCEILTGSCESDEVSTMSSEPSILQHGAQEVTEQDIPVETNDTISDINEHGALGIPQDGDYDVSEMGEQVVSDIGEHAVPDVNAQQSDYILETAQHNMPVLTEQSTPDIFEAGVSNVQHNISDIIQHVSHEIIEHCESSVIEDGVSDMDGMNQINEMTIIEDGASEVFQDSETPIIEHGESKIVEDVSEMTEVAMIEPSVSDMTQSNETAMIEQGVSNMIEDGASEISQDNETTVTEQCVSNIIIEDGECDVTQHNETEMNEDGVSNMIQIDETRISESNVIEDTTSEVIQNDETAMVEHDESNNVTDHLSDIDQSYEPVTEHNESEIIQDDESDDFVLEGELSVIAQEHQEETLSNMNDSDISTAPNMEDKNGLHGEVNGSVAHLDIAPSSVPSEACSSPASPGPASPDVLPPRHHFSDSSSNSSVEIPIQPNICISQQRLAGFKRSPPQGSPPASPKRFKFHDER